MPDLFQSLKSHVPAEITNELHDFRIADWSDFPEKIKFINPLKIILYLFSSIWLEANTIHLSMIDVKTKQKFRGLAVD